MDREKRISPLTDTGFKAYFGKEGQSEEILMFLLNELFRDKEDYSPIVSIRYGNSERLRETEELRTVIHDVYCTTSDGRRFIVEMQNVPQRFFLDRAFYYVCKGISDQGIKDVGHHWAYKYSPVIGVFLCNFLIEDIAREMVVYGRVQDEKTHKNIGNFFRFAFLQLPFVKENPKECKTKLEKLLYLIKNMEGLWENPFAAEMEAVYEKLEKVSRYTALDEKEKARYDAEWKRYNDTAAFIWDTLEQGREQGREQGKLETAKNMYKEGMSIAMISKYTGLPEEVLEKSLK